MNPHYAFSNGINCLKNRNLELAKYWFNISIKSNSYRMKSLKKLFSIELSQGRLDRARDLLDMAYNINNNDIHILNCMYGELENTEMNFQKSKVYYEKGITDLYSKESISMELARLNMQMGEFDLAQNIFTELEGSSRENILKALYLEEAYLALLLKDYNKAEELLKRVDKNSLHMDKFGYDNTHMQILYGLNRLENSEYIDTFLYDLLVKKDDTRLVGRLNEYKKHDNHIALCRFLDSINIEELLNFARNSIQNLNGRYYKNAEKYIIHSDEPIGRMDDELTNDLCVITLIGTKEIIKMNPIFVSNKFNSEGILQSEEIKRKRGKNIK